VGKRQFYKRCIKLVQWLINYFVWQVVKISALLLFPQILVFIFRFEDSCWIIKIRYYFWYNCH